MTDYIVPPPESHRAKPEQWEVVEICREEGKIPWPTAACLLELRARVEALEWANQKLWAQSDDDRFCDDLRKDRRPKPPSLKEQALKAVNEMSDCMSAGFVPKRSDLDAIRRALEALPE
jgi:hypothetical protein